MSVLPAAEAMTLLRGLAVGHSEPERDRLHHEQLTVLLGLIFLQLADARALLGGELRALHAWLARSPNPERRADAWPRLLSLFAELHARRGGRLFAPERLELLTQAAPANALVLALLDSLRPYADAEVELLGHVYEAMRSPLERRSTGSHYTPRELAEAVVARSLEPLLRVRAPASLRVCDPAMGSGAFLLATCRWLGARLGGREGALQAALSCVFGVDEDPEAVELGKLSLWLEARAGPLPFTCFDHALRCGDALVGLRVEQLRGLHWQPGQAEQREHAEQLERALEHSANLREPFIALATQLGPAAASQRQALREQAELALAPARALADQLIAAYFCSTKIRARARARAHVLEQLEPPKPLESPGAHPGPRPFHWWLEFPQLGPAGFDAILGNPPFMGKNGLLASRGRAYLDWLKLLHPGAHGNADYAAHFFRRADWLLGESGGTIGLVATNTIGQGDTRSTGLAALLAAGAQIYDALEHLEWPGAAHVTVSIVHLARGPCRAGLSCRLNGEAVERIDSRLGARAERPDPVALAANAKLAFIGTYVLGRGFVLTPAQREQLIASDPRNGARIRPYIGGEQLNTSPTQAVRRFAIDFEQLSLADACAWPELLEIVRREVKPGRDKLGDNPDGRRRKAYWWQHGRATPSLHAALAPLSRCLVTSLVSKHLMFSFQPARRLFSHKLCVFPLDSWAAFAVLQSRIHAAWAWLLSSTMRNAGINYSPSDCFECFPLPELGGQLGSGLERAGEQLERARARYMIDAELGLTKTYNALLDPRRDEPRLQALRTLHVELDRAVLAAYGWDDLAVPDYLGPRRGFEDAVIERLFALNAARSSSHGLLERQSV